MSQELDRVSLHEEAAHEKRNWVRLTYDCNNHCVFCLDTLAHDGTMRAEMDVKVQIVEGRKQGATRLILSGGEPTMHPRFLDFVRLGRRAGYRRVQTVTNGRMFSYPEFLERAAECGLDEITFSLHGHTAKLHDALVGAPGAFVQEVAGLRAALDSGRFIVNVDVVINKQNVKVLPEMLETFIEWGVREFDLLQIIPFGNAWGPAREHLFYDLEGHEEPLRRALELSRRSDIHLWLNRFPAPYAEGFEELIQDPHKLLDEVRGRREEFDRYLSTGTPLHCREPARCRHCYLEPLCDGLDQALGERRADRVDVLRLQGAPCASRQLPASRAVHLVAPDLEAARALAEAAPAGALRLELDGYQGLAEALAPDGTLFGRTLERCTAKTGAELERLLACDAPFVVVAWINRSTAPVLESLDSPGARLMLVQPRYERVTDQRREDVPDLAALCRRFPPEVRTEGIPACLGGRVPEPPGTRLDAAMLGPDGVLQMPRFTERFIADRYLTKSRRCRDCVHDARCEGVHLNFVRAHGYARLTPERHSAAEALGAGTGSSSSQPNRAR